MHGVEHLVQVTLCDHIWRVSCRSSEAGCKLLYLVILPLGRQTVNAASVHMQLQQLLADDLSKEVMSLFVHHREAGGAGGPVSTAYRRQLAESTYHRRAIDLLNDDYCFRIVFVSDRWLSGTFQ